MLVLLTGCRRANEPDPPPALDRYLSALTAKNYADAYQITDLPVSQGGSGFALTREHFVAFYERNPLKSYEVKKVTKLEHRQIQGGQVVGAPALFVIDMELRYGDGTRKESWHIEGDVVGVLQIEAVPIALRAKTVVRSILVDGVRTSVVAGGKGSARSYYLTVLNGPHRITFGSKTIEVVPPTTVVSGDATVDDGVIVLA
jgi:hypothetical protein